VTGVSGVYLGQEHPSEAGVSGEVKEERISPPQKSQKSLAGDDDPSRRQ